MKRAAILIALVLLIRLPFLNQAVQGDDPYYLASAIHAQIDPAHPNHIHYIYGGRVVDFRGYPHPPLNAWCLAALIAIFGSVREVPFHAAYIAFSLLAAWAMWTLAKQFSEKPLWATLLFLAVPVFVINGNSFESDVPFLALWLAGIALFVRGSNVLAFVALGLSSLFAVQAMFAIPILILYDRRRWWLAFAPAVVFASWQCFEYFSTGQFPLAVAAGYVQSYGLQRQAKKLRVAKALTVHLLYLAWPLVLLFFRHADRARKETWFLLSWIAIVFFGAVAIFPAGSARYLLPLAPAIALLISRLPVPLLAIGFTAQFSLSLLLASANYQHWDATRQFARSLAREAEQHRVWVNSEWGLRFYLEELGARPALENQQIPPGDILVTSSLGFPAPVFHGGSTPVVIASKDIRPSVPFRLIALESQSAYSTEERGFFPFGISTGLVDRLRAEKFVPRQPTNEYVDFAKPGADDQIVSGVYSAEGNPWRWMSQSATVLLKTPPAPATIVVHLYIPDGAPARTVGLSLDGRAITTKTFPGPGTFTIETAPESGSVLTITLDKSFHVPADHRELGVILSGAGFSK